MNYLDQLKQKNPGIAKYSDEQIIAILPKFNPRLQGMSQEEVEAFAMSEPTHIEQLKLDEPNITRYTDEQIISVLPKLKPELQYLKPEELNAYANMTPTELERSWGEVATDLGAAAASSAGSMAKNNAWMAEKLAQDKSRSSTPLGLGLGLLDGVGAFDKMKELGKNAQDYWQDKKSLDIKVQRGRVNAADGFFDTLAEVNFATAGDIAADSAAYMVPGALLSRLQAGAQGAASVLAYSEGIQEAADAGQSAEERVNNLTPADLAVNSSTYRDLRAEGKTHEQALEVVRNRAGLTAFAFTLPISVLASKLTGSAQVEANFWRGEGLDGLVDTVTRETVTEIFQEGGNMTAQNIGVKMNADARVGVTDNVGNASAQGAVGGGVMGGGMYTAQSLVNPVPDNRLSEEELDYLVNRAGMHAWQKGGDSLDAELAMTQENERQTPDRLAIENQNIIYGQGRYNQEEKDAWGRSNNQAYEGQVGDTPQRGQSYPLDGELLGPEYDPTKDPMVRGPSYVIPDEKLTGPEIIPEDRRLGEEFRQDRYTEDRPPWPGTDVATTNTIYMEPYSNPVDPTEGVGRNVVEREATGKATALPPRQGNENPRVTATQTDIIDQQLQEQQFSAMVNNNLEEPAEEPVQKEVQQAVEAPVVESKPEVTVLLKSNGEGFATERSAMASKAYRDNVANGAYVNRIDDITWGVYVPVAAQSEATVEPAPETSVTAEPTSGMRSSYDEFADFTSIYQMGGYFRDNTDYRKRLKAAQFMKDVAPDVFAKFSEQDLAMKGGQGGLLTSKQVDKVNQAIADWKASRTPAAPVKSEAPAGDPSKVRLVTKEKNGREVIYLEGDTQDVRAFIDQEKAESGKRMPIAAPSKQTGVASISFSESQQRARAFASRFNQQREAELNTMGEVDNQTGDAITIREGETVFDAPAPDLAAQIDRAAAQVVEDRELSGASPNDGINSITQSILRYVDQYTEENGIEYDENVAWQAAEQIAYDISDGVDLRPAAEALPQKPGTILRDRIATNKAPRETAAVHMDQDGTDVEAVTPEVVDDALELGISRNEFTSGKDARKWLNRQIDREINRLKQLGYTAEEGSDVPGSEVGNHITFDVPGNGKFKVGASIANLEAFKKKVNRSGNRPSAETQPDMTAPNNAAVGSMIRRADDRGESGSPNDKEAIKNFLADNEWANAYEMAQMKGLDSWFKKNYPGEYASGKQGKNGDGPGVEGTSKKPKRSTRNLRTGKESLKKFGVDSSKVQLTRDVAAALEARQIAKYGVIARDNRTKEAEIKLARWLTDEVKHELENGADKSGVGWYSEKFQRALDIMGDAFPELLEDKVQRDLMTVLIAITSDGQKVVPNFRQAMDIYRNYQETGNLTTGRGHKRQSSINNNLKTIGRLINTMGLEGMHEYLLQEKSVSELKQLAKAAGGEMKSDYQASVMMPMAALELGPKLGAFYANLMGAHGYLTMDLWWSRTINRLRGTLLTSARQEAIRDYADLTGRPEMTDAEILEEIKGPWSALVNRNYKTRLAEIVGRSEPSKKIEKARWHEEAQEKAGEQYEELLLEHNIERKANTLHKDQFENLEDAPFNATDRTFMLNVAGRVQKSLKRGGYDISIADIQAILWYYEKRLYSEMGARQSADISYEEAAQQVASEFANSNRPKRSPVQAGREDQGANAQGRSPRTSEQTREEVNPNVRNLQRAFDWTNEGITVESAVPDSIASQFTNEIAETFGQSINWITESSGEIDGLALDGEVFISVDSYAPYNVVLGHELVHVLKEESPELYQELEALILPNAEGLEASAEFHGQEPGSEEANEEYVADVVGNEFGNKQFWQDMADVNASLFRKIARQARALLERIVGMFRNRNMQFGEEVKNLNKLRRDIAKIMAQFAANRKPGQTQQGFAAKYAPGYHGTPHTVDRFDLSKVGTGEGAAAYGWGMYFASNREIAEHYAKTLSDGVIFEEMSFGDLKVFEDERPADYDPRYYGGEAGANLVENLLINEYRMKEIFEDDGEKGVKQWLKRELRISRDYYEEQMDDYPEYANEMLALLDDIEQQPITVSARVESGNVYKVEIPEENELMSWDEPLSSQTGVIDLDAIQVALDQSGRIDEVVEALEESDSVPFGVDVEAMVMKALVTHDQDVWTDLKDFDNPDAVQQLKDLKSEIGLDLEVDYDSGETLYRSLEATLGSDKAASEFLFEQGIKGLRYLDGVSRDGGESKNHNYVIWDENVISIEEVNDQAVSKPKFSRRNRTDTRQRASESHTDLTDDQKSFLDKIAPTTVKESLKDQWEEWKQDWQIKFRQAVVDRYASLEKLDKDVFGPDVIENNTINSSWVLAKMSSSADGAVGAMMNNGRLEMKGGAITLRDKTNTDSGLLDVFAKLGDPTEIERFFGWIAANRSKKLMEQEREILFTEEEIEGGVKLNEGRTAKNENRKALYDGVYKEFLKYRDDVLTIADDAGLLKKGMDPDDAIMFLANKHKVDMPLYNKVKAAQRAQRQAMDDPDLYDMKGEQAGQLFEQLQDKVMELDNFDEEYDYLTTDQKDLWMNEFYVPFYRILEEQQAESGPKQTRGLTRQEAYKKLKGSKRPLKDLMENTIKNFHHLLAASLKNQAAIVALRNAEMAGIAEEVSESKRNKKTSTYILKDGMKVWYNISDPLVFSAVTALSDSGFNNIAMRAMRGAKRLLTMTVTSSPQFWAANSIRDSVQATAIGNLSYNAPMNFGQGVIDYGTPLAPGKLRGEMLASGAAFSFGHLYGSGNAEEIHRELERMIKGAQVIRGPEDVLPMLRKAWDFYAGFGDAFENANRAAIYKQNLDKGELYASFMARDLMDFGARGNSAAILFLTDTVPFLNARIQGLDRLYRGGGRSNINVGKDLWGNGTASDSDRKAAKRFNMVTGMLALASVLLYMKNRDDEEYKKLEDWQKDAYWYFRVGEHQFFIPKPFEVGAIATVAERAAEQMVDDEVEKKVFFKRLSHMLLDTFSFNPTPQAVAPIVDLYANKDSFTGRPIESMADQRVSKSLRKDQNTTVFAEQSAKLLNSAGEVISPKQIDHLVDGYLGWLGTLITETGTTLYQMADGQSTPAKEWYEYQPMRRFYRNTNKPGYTKYGTEFYEYVRQATQAYYDTKFLAQAEGEVAARENLEGKMYLLENRKIINKAQQGITKINNAMKLVRADRSLSAQAKRAQLDQLQTMKNEIQKTIVDALNLARKQSK